MYPPKIVPENDVRPGGWVYRLGMRMRVQAADAVAALILVVFVAVVGTGAGVAAAHVRSSSQPKSGPLKMILRGGGSNEVPSIQRDRVHFRNR